jgi:glyoxylase-like metal-dependent hydrolase (beta-lactamase superfamily II)
VRALRIGALGLAVLLTAMGAIGWRVIARGHTLGHSVVLVQLEEAAALVAGDALDTLRHLDPDALDPFNYFGPQGLAIWQDSTRRIATLARPRADLTSPEWATLRGEQAKLFDAAGHLLPAARPRWDPAAGGVTSDVP